MMAMLRYIEDYCLDTEVTLLYCVRTKQDIMFRQELDELQTRLKNLEYHLLLSRPEPKWLGARGHINREFVANHIADMNGRVFFVWGPPLFMDTARTILSDLGVALDRIRVETFGGAGASPKAGSPGASDGVFTVEFARSGKIAMVRQGQTLLETAIENGVSIPSACRQGQCGTCKTRMLEGQVHVTAEQGLDAESQARGFILTCVARPDGDVRLDV